MSVQWRHARGPHAAKTHVTSAKQCKAVKLHHAGSAIPAAFYLHVSARDSRPLAPHFVGRGGQPTIHTSPLPPNGMQLTLPA